MNERTVSARTTVESGGGLGSVFGDDSIFAPTVNLVHGMLRDRTAADGTVGEIRRRYGDRLEIDAETPAFLDGHPVADDVRVRAGQTLTFMRRAGEKGVSAAPASAGDLALAVRGEEVEAVSPEGARATMPLGALLAAVAPAEADTGDVALPPGVRSVRSRGDATIWVHETPPQVWNLRWIAADSPRPYAGATYRDVVIALPYLVVIAGFRRLDDGRVSLAEWNECFFRTAPLERCSHDRLSVPALLNCSLFGPIAGGKKIGVEGRPVVWICTQHLDRGSFHDEPDVDRRRRLGFEALLKTLLATGFNFSSDVHEFTSGFTQSTGVDPRIASVETWEAATREDPDFVLKVPWHDTGYTVHEVVERMFERLGRRASRPPLARDLARIVFGHTNGARRRRSRPAAE